MDKNETLCYGDLWGYIGKVCNRSFDVAVGWVDILEERCADELE